MADLAHRIAVAAELGRRLQSRADEAVNAAVALAKHKNGWFTEAMVRQSLDGIATQYLDETKLREWTATYPIEDGKARRVGLVLAGNIPMVGFHDILAVYISGHTAVIKPSSKDEVLTKLVVDLMIQIDPAVAEQVILTERLKDYDAVIATGSNNTSRYFKEYFAHVPNIIRRNRNGVAVITGKETKADFVALGQDIFTYFGLGCRNVSKMYVPQNYDFSPMLGVLHDHYKEYVLHHKYKNNFDFNHALFMLNKEEFLMSGSLLVKKATQIPSRIASVHYEYYDCIEVLKSELKSKLDDIQCIVSGHRFDGLPSFGFGEAQRPSLTDYADGVDTMTFLTELYA